MKAHQTKPLNNAAQNVPSLHAEEGFRLDGFRTFWGDTRSTLMLNSTLQDLYSQRTRNTIYANIRHLSGLPFADFGDEPEKWLAWLKNDDDSGASEARRAYAALVAADGLPSWAAL